MNNLFLNFNNGYHLPHIELKFPQGYDLEKKQPVPKHPKNKSGVCLVVGTHPDWERDFDEAARRIDDAGLELCGICAINDAASLIHADYIATAHPEKIDQFLEDVSHDVEIHSRKKMKRPKALGCEYVWNLNTGGGSGLFAVSVMIAIGHDLVVMCGCPMDGGGGYAVKKHNGTIEDPRFGDLSPRHTLVQGWHGHLKRFKEENSSAHKVRSMSGVTKQIFGGL